MSAREMAISIINNFTEAQLVEFIKEYSNNGTQTKNDEQDHTVEEKDLEERRRAFEELTRMIEESAPIFADIGDNDKEVLAKYREEKYGEGV